MKKKLISLSNPQFKWLREESSKLGISASELVRRALDEYRRRGRRKDGARDSRNQKPND